jgi:lysophospholipase L1-like esterase
MAVGRILFGFWCLFAAILLLELALQLGAWYVSATGRERPTALQHVDLEVLCLGDSATYGLRLELEEAYPHQLESLWNQTSAPPRIRVDNLGYPGMNSSRLLRDFSRMLESFSPDVAIVMIGANNFWTLPVESEDKSNPPTLSLLSRHSRVMKLVRMLRGGAERPVLSIPHETIAEQSMGVGEDEGYDQQNLEVARYGDDEFILGFTPSGQWMGRGGLEPDLRDIIRIAEQFETRLILMTYPSQRELYGGAGEIIRATAGQARAHLVDLSLAFAPVCPEVVPPVGTAWCSEYLFTDDHPNANGYRLIAETLIPSLMKTFELKHTGFSRASE